MLLTPLSETVAPLLDEVFDVYDFYDTLDYIFDSSQPSWRTCSTTRASSLLRKTLSLATVLKMITSGKLNNLIPFSKGICAFDPNAGQWLLEQFPGIIEEEGPQMVALLELYSSIILSDLPGLVKTTAISNLAWVLEDSQAVRRGSIPIADLPSKALIEQIEIDAAAQTCNREMADSVLRFQGCLLTITALTGQWQWEEPLSGEFATLLGRWTIKLQHAIQEETVSTTTGNLSFVMVGSHDMQEFTTRYAAVASLSAFAGVLRQSGGAARMDPVFLEVYLVLYDMLNDDDEELRDIAAATASWVLSYSTVSPSKAVSLAPLNAARLLVQFIIDNYAESRVLYHKVLQYISGQIPRISDLPVQRATLTPVANLITEYRKESMVLFVEEKQNLFIDEVREIELWSSVVTRLTAVPLLHNENDLLLQDRRKWVLEGLVYLSETVANDTEKDGLLGWSSKPEIFTLGVRIISIAAALISKRVNEQEGVFVTGEYQRELEEKIGLALERGYEAFWNEEWLLRLRAALE